MENIIVHITLPKGLKLTNGAYLANDITVDVVSSLTPFYASIDQVRLEGGSYIRNLSDLTLASAIYSASRKADQFCSVPPAVGSQAYDSYILARNVWVTATVSLQMLLNILNRFGKQAHVLANFSVTKDIDVDKKIDELRAIIAANEPVLRSCGTAAVNGRPKPKMAAKGVNDWTERTPGRTWASTGMGANAMSEDPLSATGGRGKPMSFFSQPFFSIRTGIFQSSRII
jgi:hypothetical protein